MIYTMIYVKKITKKTPEDSGRYPYNIPSIAHLDELKFDRDVTFITGDNGSGKSTIVEAIAVKAGFNPEGGGMNFNFNTCKTHSDLHENIVMTRGPVRNKDGYFMRAETFYNVATEIDRIAWGIHAYYGGGSLHKKSHGESFLSVFTNRFYGSALYIFDEPEAALSIKSIFSLMIKMKELVAKDSQFIIATHSPILLAYPDADIYSISDSGWNKVEYEETEQYRLTKYFVNNYGKVIDDLLVDSN